MFNLLPPEMCQVCFHVHQTTSVCNAADDAPGPNGEIVYLGVCKCETDANAEYVKHLRLVECDGSCKPLRTARHWHTRYDPDA